MYFPLVTGPLFVIYKPVQIVTTKQVDKSVLVSFNIRGDENYIIKMMIILAEITQKNRVTPYIIFFFHFRWHYIRRQKRGELPLRPDAYLQDWLLKSQLNIMIKAYDAPKCVSYRCDIFKNFQICYDISSYIDTVK